MWPTLKALEQIGGSVSISELSIKKKGKCMNYYNGYSPKERERKLRNSNKLIKTGEMKLSSGPCDICGDPDCPTEYHSEDYSVPFKLEEYSLCHYCHIFALHQRYRKPFFWQAYKAHIRRGGYARDFKKNPEIKKEVYDLYKAYEQGKEVSLIKLREKLLTGDEWWEKLTPNEKSLWSFNARPRAYEDFQRAFHKLPDEITAKQMKIINFHLNAPDMTISMQELAAHMGYANYNAANLVYGSLAKKICEQSEYEPPSRSNGSLMYMHILAHEGEPKTNGEFTWKMNISAARVFKEYIEGVEQSA